MVVGDSTSFPLEYFSIPPQYTEYLSSVLLPHGLIQDRVEKLARDIVQDYPSSTPHLLVVLKGGSEFATDLTRCLRRIHGHTPLKHIPYTVDYVRVKSYSGTESTGTVTISGIDMKTLVGRDLIVVEDIIDTGVTMTQLIPELKKHAPTSVRVSALLEKRTHKSNGFKGDYVGFSVPDSFVVGYNLDYNEAFRDMPHICIINGAGIEHFRAHPAVSWRARSSSALGVAQPLPPLLTLFSFTHAPCLHTTTSSARYQLLGLN